MDNKDIENLIPTLTSWRQKLHSQPEIGFDENYTAAFIAEKLRSFGLDDVVEGVGGTGVVGTLKRGEGTRSIALRADMDALRILEQSQHSYNSANKGLMHACGHDGHICMLLGAAKWLAEAGAFNGTARFIFQPAEEWGQGALAMLNDGLLSKFHFDEIYGIHNLPGLPVGDFATRSGAFMAAEDIFEITLKGVGGHASQPHKGCDIMVAASSLVLQLQTIVSRRIDPASIAVVSVTEFITDGIRNALPNKIVLKGDARSFLPEVSHFIEEEMRRMAKGTAASFNCDVQVTYSSEFIPLINEDQATKNAVKAALEVFDQKFIDSHAKPLTIAEDFAQFLNFVPGNFSFIGNGENSWPLHHPCFDFNDDALIFGVKYFIELVHNRLSM